MLSSELADYNAQVDQLAGEVAILRNREAIVVAELRRVQARLNREKDQLERLKHQLQPLAQRAAQPPRRHLPLRRGRTCSP